MAATDKDLKQKRAAIQFCSTSGLVPFYEVNVSNAKDFSDKPSLLTDIDVLGLSQNHLRMSRVLFDCKTTKASPINRAFWAGGLARYTEAEECYVILKRAAPEVHRLAAKSLRVHLFDEIQFSQHAQALSSQPLSDDEYVLDMDRWHALHDVFRSNAPFEKLGDYLRQVVPLERDAPKIVRGILANVRHARGELDPSKKPHLGVYFYAVMGFAIAMSTVALEIFNAFDPKQTKDAFERFLRDYIWGGRESYVLRRKLKEAMAARTESPPAVLELYAWEDFINLVRTLIDSPESVFLSCLPLTGMALRSFDSASAVKDASIKIKLSQNNRQRQFLFRLSSYLTAACELPKEFDDQFKADLNEVMA